MGQTDASILAVLQLAKFFDGAHHYTSCGAAGSGIQWVISLLGNIVIKLYPVSFTPTSYSFLFFFPL